MAFPDLATAINDPSTLLQGVVPKPIIIDDLHLTVLIDEGQDRSWESSDYALGGRHPVSGGRTKAPRILNIQGLLTSTSIGLGSIVTSLVNTGKFKYQTWQDMRDRLRAIADSNKPFTVVLDTETIPNMEFTNLSEGRNKDTGSAYFFTAQLKTKRIVSSAVSEIDPSQIPEEILKTEEPKGETSDKVSKASSAKDAGSKTTKKATPEDIDPLTTLVNTSVDGIAGLISGMF
jgi:hypothetical protein